MQTIFIMVKCERGRAYEVADAAVQNVEQVSEMHSISGQYDLLMKISCWTTKPISGASSLVACRRWMASRTRSPSHRVQGVYLRRPRRSHVTNPR